MKINILKREHFTKEHKYEDLAICQTIRNNKCQQSIAFESKNKQVSCAIQFKPNGQSEVENKLNLIKASWSNAQFLLYLFQV